MDYVELDLRNMGVKRWITRALDRTERVSVVGKPRQILEVCGGKEEEYAEKKIALCALCCIAVFCSPCENSCF
jgi:hypothetical protein